MTSLEPPSTPDEDFFRAMTAKDVFYARWEHGPMRVQISLGMAFERDAIAKTVGNFRGKSG